MVILEVILLFYLLFSFAGMFFKAVPVILLLPAAPFICASDIKSKQPGLAWSIIILYSFLYTGAIIALIIAALF